MSERSLFKHPWPTVPQSDSISQMPTTRPKGVRGVICSHTARTQSSLSHSTCALDHCSRWTALDPDSPRWRCRRVPGLLPCLDVSLFTFLEHADPCGTGQGAVASLVVGTVDVGVGQQFFLTLADSPLRKAHSPCVRGASVQDLVGQTWKKNMSQAGAGCQLPRPRLWVQDARLLQLLRPLKALPEAGGRGLCQLHTELHLSILLPPLEGETSPR